MNESCLVLLVVSSGGREILSIHEQEGRIYSSSPFLAYISLRE
jgi:hypothetical protein